MYTGEDICERAESSSVGAAEDPGWELLTSSWRRPAGDAEHLILVVYFFKFCSYRAVLCPPTIWIFQVCSLRVDSHSVPPDVILTSALWSTATGSVFCSCSFHEDTQRHSSLVYLPPCIYKRRNLSFSTSGLQNNERWTHSKHKSCNKVWEVLVIVVYSCMNCAGKFAVNCSAHCKKDVTLQSSVHLYISLLFLSVFCFLWVYSVDSNCSKAAPSFSVSAVYIQRF